MVVIEDFEMPESCFRCTKRKCLHIDGKAYQMCGLNEDGYLTESWFNSENIPKDHRSEHCPLREVEAIPKDQYEARLKADLKAILTDLYMEIEELDTPSDDSYDACIVDCEKLIQEKINNLQVNNSKVKEQDDAEV